jgi:HSP20 family protein
MPRDPFETAQREIERFWRDLVYRGHAGAHFAEQPWVPAADVVVSEHSARVILELAGVPRDAVRVRLRGRILEVSGRRVPPQEPGGTHYHRAEIYFGEFQRLIELPWEADEKGIQAQYRDGMLEITIQAAVPEPSREVPVREATP